MSQPEEASAPASQPEEAAAPVGQPEEDAGDEDADAEAGAGAVEAGNGHRAARNVLEDYSDMEDDEAGPAVVPLPRRNKRSLDLDEDDYALLEEAGHGYTRPKGQQTRRRLQKASERDTAAAPAAALTAAQREAQLKTALFGDDDGDDDAPPAAGAGGKPPQQPRADELDEPLGSEDEMECAAARP